MGDGVLFKIDTDGKHFKVEHSFHTKDGIGPHGSLTLYHGDLYGMTSSGGAAGGGTIFRFDPKSGKLKVIYSFQGEPGDGSDGLDNVFIADHRIFGMTKYGGSVAGTSDYQNGVVFSIPLPC